MFLKHLQIRNQDGITDTKCCSISSNTPQLVASAVDMPIITAYTAENEMRPSFYSNGFCASYASRQGTRYSPSFVIPMRERMHSLWKIFSTV
jgi:hypothetical protein